LENVEKVYTYTWKYCPGNFNNPEREDLTVPKLSQFCTYIKHKGWVVRHLDREDSLYGPHNQDIEEQLTDKYHKLEEGF